MSAVLASGRRHHANSPHERWVNATPCDSGTGSQAGYWDTSHPMLPVRWECVPTRSMEESHTLFVKPEYSVCPGHNDRSEGRVTLFVCHRLDLTPKH